MALRSSLIDMDDDPDIDGSEEDDDQVEQSLDELGKAFAQAMDRNRAHLGDAKGDVASANRVDNESGLEASGEPGSDVDMPVDAERSGEASDEFVDANDPDAELDTVPDLEEPEEDHCPISPQTILEAILFVGHPENEPVTSQSVAALLRGVDADEVDGLVVTLNGEYEELGYPLHVASLDGGYQLDLHEDFEHVRERFYGRVRQARLSQAAVDVLAIVAYHQPCTREEVDKLLRTHNSGRILNQLLRRELILRRTTDDKPKRREFVTTERFLALFQLGGLEDLPRSEDPQ